MATKTATAEKLIEANVEKATKAFADVNVKAKEAMEKGTKLMADVTEIAKANVEALVESGKIAAKGGEALAKDAAEYGKSTYEAATTAFKEFAAAKTPAELFQLQTNFAKSSMESAIKEATKGSEALLKFAGEVIAPISTRYSVNVEKFKTAFPF
jgi:phasin family protein